MNRLLIVMGAPGAGKSTYGKLLKNYDVFDLDDYGHCLAAEALHCRNVAIIHCFDRIDWLLLVASAFPSHEKHLVLLDGNPEELFERQVARGRFISLEETRKFHELCKSAYDIARPYFHGYHIISPSRLSERAGGKVSI